MPSNAQEGLTHANDRRSPTGTKLSGWTIRLLLGLLLVAGGFGLAFVSWGDFCGMSPVRFTSYLLATFFGTIPVTGSRNRQHGLASMGAARCGTCRDSGCDGSDHSEDPPPP
jgi:hypothetical protein